MNAKHSGLGYFARNILGKPLYPYQEAIGEAILKSIKHKLGLTFTVMLARQMGKNQLSAILEAYLLASSQQGSIVKAAPTFQPQIVNSRMRLLSMLERPLLASRVWRSDGHIIGVAPRGQTAQSQAGPRILFFSAGPEASIVGATASLLLEVDEAQGVAIDKFDVELKPMASTTNATTVLYGTAWSDDTLLATVAANNLALQERDGIQRHFQHDWRTLAAFNPRYKRFVEGEIARLGEDHISIRTQYRLLPISSAGFLFNDLQRHALRGQHTWQDEPDGDLYIAAMDVGGEERQPSIVGAHPRGRPDSTVITIARVSYNDIMLPSIEVVHHYWWTGKHYLEQYAETIAICEKWGIQRLVIDRTGLGEVMASLLEAKLGSERVIPFRFSRPSKSMLTYQLLSFVNSGRLKLYRQYEAPAAIHDECWKQMRLARYRVPGEHILDMYVDPAEGHDDFLMSLALACEALKTCSAPVADSQFIRPKRLYQDGRY